MPARSIVPSRQRRGRYVFRGPLVRRLTAEQFLDTSGRSPTPGPRSRRSRGSSDQAEPGATTAGRPMDLELCRGSDRVPKPGETITSAEDTRVEAGQPAEGRGRDHLRQRILLWVNGRQLPASNDWTAAGRSAAGNALKTGTNELMIVARNGGDSPNAAGLFFEAGSAIAGDGDERRVDAVADDTVAMDAAPPDAAGQTQPADEPSGNRPWRWRIRTSCPAIFATSCAVLGRAAAQRLVRAGGAVRPIR